jgi:hypothetical protein
LIRAPPTARRHRLRLANFVVVTFTRCDARYVRCRVLPRGSSAFVVERFFARLASSISRRCSNVRNTASSISVSNFKVVVPRFYRAHQPLWSCQVWPWVRYRTYVVVCGTSCYLPPKTWLRTTQKRNLISGTRRYPAYDPLRTWAECIRPDAIQSREHWL